MTAAIQSFFQNRVNRVGLLLAVLCAYLLFPIYFETIIDPIVYNKNPGQSLDVSWALAMNYIHIEGLNWGNDFVFTYGPLGSFCTRIGWGHSKFLFLALDVFIAANYLLLFFLSFKKSSDKLATVLVILIVTAALPFWVGPAQAIVLLLFLVFWIRMGLDDAKPLYYFFQISLVVLLFFLKFNVGLIVFVLFFLALIYQGYSRKLKPIPTIGIAMLPVIIIFILSPLLNVSLLPYLVAGIDLVTGYNAIMYLGSEIPKARYYVLAMGIVLTALLAVRLYREADKFKSIVVFLLFAVPFFVLYKQGFVRADKGHMVDFFYFSPLLVLCIADFHFRRMYHITLPLLVGVLWMPFQFIVVDLKYPLGLGYKFDKGKYVNQFAHFSAHSGFQKGTATTKLPAEILQKIGSHTIDVYPWDIRLLLDNGLHYLPRPVCQSYSAYTPYLENRNFDHFNSQKAPQFVLYEYLSTDNRYALFEEPKVNLALSRNYEVTNQFDFDGRRFLLLEKKKDFKPLRFTHPKTLTMAIDAPLFPEKNKYYEVGVAHSLSGKLVSIVAHEPEIALGIQLAGKPIKNFRTSKPVLQTGIFSNQFLTDTSDAANFFSGQPDGKAIVRYLFEPKNRTLFSDTIEVVSYEIEQ